MTAAEKLALERRIVKHSLNSYNARRPQHACGGTAADVARLVRDPDAEIARAAKWGRLGDGCLARTAKLAAKAGKCAAANVAVQYLSDQIHLEGRPMNERTHADLLSAANRCSVVRQSKARVIRRGGR